MLVVPGQLLVVDTSLHLAARSGRGMRHTWGALMSNIQLQVKLEQTLAFEAAEERATARNFKANPLPLSSIEPRYVRENLKPVLVTAPLHTGMTTAFPFTQVGFCIF